MVTPVLVTDLRAMLPKATPRANQGATLEGRTLANSGIDAITKAVDRMLNQKVFDLYQGLVNLVIIGIPLSLQQWQ